MTAPRGDRQPGEERGGGESPGTTKGCERGVVMQAGRHPCCYSLGGASVEVGPCGGREHCLDCRCAERDGALPRALGAQAAPVGPAVNIVELFRRGGLGAVMDEEGEGWMRDGTAAGARAAEQVMSKRTSSFPSVCSRFLRLTCCSSTPPGPKWCAVQALAEPALSARTRHTATSAAALCPDMLPAGCIVVGAVWATGGENAGKCGRNWPDGRKKGLAARSSRGSCSPS